MGKHYVTITGQNHYLGMKPFKVRRIVKLVKDTENEFDSEAIRVKLPYIGTIGYVANSCHTVFLGTCSAGRIYDSFENDAYGRILFITHSGAIAELVSKEEAEKEMSIDTF